jgi:hypothetical protein
MKVIAAIFCVLTLVLLIGSTFYRVINQDWQNNVLIFCLPIQGATLFLAILVLLRGVSQANK